LLSRIDGQTSWKLLREIGGLSPGAVDLCIEDWLLQGFIDIDGRPPRVKRRRGAIPDPPGKRQQTTSGPIDESLIDRGLDLDAGIQREILEFEQRLEVDEFALLGVKRSADSREIKRVYFALSKRFHPDRYFRKNVGHYAARLETIFKRVSEAYELLSDSVSRAAIEERLAPVERVEMRSENPAASTPEQPLTPIERLRRRMPFRIPKAVSDEKAAKGAEFFKVATQAKKMGRLSEAASNLRLAVAFDPFNRDYKRALGEVQTKVAFERIEALLKGSSWSSSSSDASEAQRLADEVLLYRPGDAAACDLAARVQLWLENAERADEYSLRAIDLAPEVGAFRRTLAGVHRLRGNKGHAWYELKKALELDSGDVEAREMLEALRIKPRRMLVNGG
jgi:curved DNA-binding protein CbpA